jgi:hypothetical protein
MGGFLTTQKTKWNLPLIRPSVQRGGSKDPGQFVHQSNAFQMWIYSMQRFGKEKEARKKSIDRLKKSLQIKRFPIRNSICKSGLAFGQST